MFLNLFGLSSLVLRNRERKAAAPPTTIWRYDALRCVAHTKSEARAKFKRMLGVDRLPAGALVVRNKSA